MLIDALEAARRLGVKPATLYAYVSRGLLRSAPGPDSRERRYYKEDVARLKQLRRSGRRAGAPPKAFDATAPVLDTSLSMIEGGRLYYRGQDATELAGTSDLEAIAELLWDQGPSLKFDMGPLKPELARLLVGPNLPVTPLDRARVILVELSMHDVGALDVSAQAAARAGARLLPALASAVTGSLLANRAPLHRQIARAWKLDEAASDLVRRCLVLVADHELNASTYVARCIASTGASPYAAILGALGALSGPRHGGETSKVEALLRQVLQTRDVKAAVAERLQRGERVPGFDHPLYPDGDARAKHILDAVTSSQYGRQSEKVLDIAREIAALIGRRPNIDFALGLVSIVLKLPVGSGLGMFLAGRAVGWIAHVIEQYASGVLIRPRARYVGPLPTTMR